MTSPRTFTEYFEPTINPNLSKMMETKQCLSADDYGQEVGCRGSGVPPRFTCGVNTRGLSAGRRIGCMSLVVLMTFMTSVNGGQMLYVSASTDRAIFGYSVQETGELDFKSKAELPAPSGEMAFSPDNKFLYVAVDSGDDSRIATLQRTADGSLSLRDTATIGGRPCYLRTDHTGRYLLIADYSGGTVSVLRIVDGFCTGELVDHHKTERTAHCVELDPSGRFAFVPHVKPNKVYQYFFDANLGTLTPNDPPFVVGPDKNHKFHEPRHYAHHPTLNVAYTSNEFGGGITAWKFNPQTGTLTRWKTLSTLDPAASGDFYAADIKLTPNGRFAYVSNRDQTERPEGAKTYDSLAGFSLDPSTGMMTLIGHVPTPNQTRSLCIDRSGRFLYSAGTNSSTLFAYRIDQKTGTLEKCAIYETGKTPTWLVCANVSD